MVLSYTWVDGNYAGAIEAESLSLSLKNIL